MKFVDSLVLDSASLRRTRDGYAVAEVRVARAGNVQEYYGRELGIDRHKVRIYRPVDEVFNRDAIASYAGVPITLGHPAGNVTAATWKDLAVGETGDDVLRDGEFVRIPIMLRDIKAITAVEDGVRELSMGYNATLRMEDGVSPAGDPYDAVMGSFKMNHLAVVKVARGGSELRIGDSANNWGASPVTDERNTDMELRKVLVDGLQVETTEAGAHAITKLTKDLQTSAASIADLNTTHAAAIAAKDAVIAAKDKELAAKDAALDAAKAKIVSDADLDKRVAARSALIDTARRIAKDVKTDGLSDADVRRATVAAVLGDELVKGKTETYIDARFEILVEDAEKAGGKDTDAFRDTRQQGFASVVTDADKVRMAIEAEERNAWKGKAA